jgi:hypothetical protein
MNKALRTLASGVLLLGLGHGRESVDARSANPCQPLIDDSRFRLRKLRNEIDETNKLESIDCGRSLDCLEKARENRAQRGRELKKEETRWTRKIRDCQAEVERGSADTVAPAAGPTSVPPGDSVTAGVMEELRRLDDEIARQQKVVESPQSGFGGPARSPEEKEAELLKLQRLIDKRHQTFETLRMLMEGQKRAAEPAEETPTP